MIKVNNASKVYHMYDKPIDRLKESLHPFKKDFHKSFYALDDVSFHVEKGDTIGIIGKNGSGKSTLLKMITGVLSPSQGSIEVGGKISAILELGAGFNPELSGVDNVYLNGTVQGLSKDEITERLPQIKAFADIGDFINRPVKTYSSGMFSRLAFAVAINVNPDILIVDEALAVGDMKFQTKCFNRFKDLREQGVTILFVGHDVSSIRKFCNKVLWLHEGKVIRYGDTLEITAEYMEYMNAEDGAFDFNKNKVEETEETGQTEVVMQETEKEKPKKEKKKPVIAHWGSQQGLIQEVSLFNTMGIETDFFELGEKMKIKVKTKMPENADFSQVSIAISLKDKQGTDLIVSTTHDTDMIRFNAKQEVVEVDFEVINYLNEGEYYLAVSVEDRTYDQPQYYDFIEGTGYFRVLLNRKVFGQFHPEFKQTSKTLQTKGE